MNDYKYMVATKCYTYNQAKYIKETMNGFVVQETKFPVIYCIVDDASTDGEQEVIRNYLSNNFQTPYRVEESDDYSLTCAIHKNNSNCVFVYYSLKYNHYTKKKSKRAYLNEWWGDAKYYARCEGDDYWTDPLKIQKQYDFMESHPEFSMCFHPYQRLYNDGSYKMICPDIRKSVYSANDIILLGDHIMATNSMFQRAIYLQHEELPDFWKISPVGDFAMKIYYASKGPVGYINDIMSVYRVHAIGSWTSQKKNFIKKIKHRIKIIKTYRLYDKYTEKKYHKYIMKEIRKSWAKIFLVGIKDIVQFNY